MSMDEQDWARDEYESELASKTLEEDGLRYALEEKGQEVEAAVREWQAEKWLDESRDWLDLINIVSQHDREQLRNSVRYRAIFGGKPSESPEETESRLFNLGRRFQELGIVCQDTFEVWWRRIDPTGRSLRESST